MASNVSALDELKNRSKKRKVLVDGAVVNIVKFYW